MSGGMGRPRCTFEGCDSRASWKGYCDKHYRKVTDGAKRHVIERKSNPLEHRFWNKVDRRGPDDCWEWTGARNPAGYGTISRGSGDTRRLLAHRASVYVITGVLPPPEVHVCHRCDNPPCVNPAHLFLGDDNANKQDAINKLRHAHGVRNAKARLTDQKVWAIRILVARGDHSIESLHLLHGVSRNAIRAVVVGESWRHAKFTPITPSLSDAMLASGLAERYRGKP